MSTFVPAGQGQDGEWRGPGTTAGTAAGPSQLGAGGVLGQRPGAWQLSPLQQLSTAPLTMLLAAMPLTLWYQTRTTSCYTERFNHPAAIQLVL